jgi:RNA polymerase sigma-70 factor (ECF subfamily)
MKDNHEFFFYLYDRYYNKIYKYCYNMLYFKHNEAEECTQNTFLKAYENLDKLYTHINPAGWLYKTAHNFVMRSKVKMSKDSILIEYNDTIVMSYCEDIINDIEESIILSDNEIEECVNLILSNLSSKEYDLYNMFYVKKMAIKDIALSLNTTPGSCRIRLFRLRKTIKDIVKQIFNS